MPATARVAGRGEPYRGHEGLRTYLADVARVWQELRSEPAEFIEVGDVVVCTGRVYAWGVGRVIDAPAGWVWRLRGSSSRTAPWRSRPSSRVTSASTRTARV